MIFLMQKFLTLFKRKCIENQNQQTICYVNVNSINLSILNDKIKNLFSEFNIVHADGFGVFLGSKILYGKDGLSHRMVLIYMRN